MSEPQNPYGQDPYRQYPVQDQNPVQGQQSMPQQPTAPQSWADPRPQPWGQVPPEPPHGTWPVTYQQPGGLVPTTPPPKKSTGKTILGWILLVWTVLGVLSILSRMGQGTFVLWHPDDPARSLGALMGHVIFLGLPGWGAYRLLTSHRRAMEAWRRQQGQLPPR